MDYLFFGAHPDDVEISCAGLILKEKKRGKKTGIIDLTQGELGSRGSATLRLQEAKKAAALLGVTIRENLGLADGFFENNPDNKLALIRYIRKYRPKIVFANASFDRHPDHGRAHHLVREAVFLSGLPKINTLWEGKDQHPWRPHHIFYYIQDRYQTPDFAVGISEEMEEKLTVLSAYSSQFHSADYTVSEQETYISTPAFWTQLKARAAHFGKLIGVPYAEGFKTDRTIGIKYLDALEGELF